MLDWNRFGLDSLSDRALRVVKGGREGTTGIVNELASWVLVPGELTRI